jgi:AraC family transcriptional activator of pobA
MSLWSSSRGKVTDSGEERKPMAHSDVARPSDIPRVVIYGEPDRRADFTFLHVERIPLRSRPNDWTIRLHAHDDVHQVFLVMREGGRVRVDATELSFEAPALLVVPAGAVHGFTFRPGTDGYVLSLSRAIHERLASYDYDLGAAFERHAVLGSLEREADLAGLESAFATVAHEVLWSAPARQAAVEGALLRILVSITRHAPARTVDWGRAAQRDRLIVERFRMLVEQNFRANLSIGAYAARLGVSEARLTTACRRMLGSPAIRLIHRRIMIEAERHLAYSTMAVGEIAAALGFTDPAYFSRFFTKHAGKSPSEFRTRHGSRFS